MRRKKDIDAEIKDLEEELENIREPEIDVESKYRKTIDILECGIKRQEERTRKKKGMVEMVERRKKIK